MPLYQAVILAIIQGLTEFLPVSSTAHLVLVPWLAGWQDPGKAFDVALHAGTLFAVLAYFWRAWIELALPGFGIRFPATATDQEFRARRQLFWFLALGTVPGGVAGLLLQHFVEEHLSQPIPIALAMMGLGLLMAWADARPSVATGHSMEQMTFADTILIGVSQALALLPGVSRSGITITTGLLRGLSREAAARFSFLLATPIIAGAALYEIPKLLKTHRAGAMDLPLGTLLIAVAVSAVVGYAVIAFLMRYLKTRSLKIFVVYRLTFGMVILLLAFLQFHSAR
jgi:undecaprenyl-diphosphatase